MIPTLLTKVIQMKQSPASFLLILMLSMAGCEKTDTSIKSDVPVPMVTVAPPLSKPVTHYEYFTGRLEPTEQVEIRARVSGYLVKIYFKPGTEVKKGDKLFEIDPKPFEADMLQVQSQIARTKATLDRASLDFGRTEQLRKSGAASQEDYDKALSSKLEADATLKADKARLEMSQLNLGYTKIDAPISGLIGDQLVTEGNLIAGGQAGTTLLTTIVAVEKMDIGFDVDENTFQRVQQSVREGKLKKSQDGKIPVEMGLAVHGTQYPFKGDVNFINNQVDPKTGTIRLKGEFDNPRSPEGSRVLTAGMFARVRVRLGSPVQTLLLPDSAMGWDQGTKFIYTVGPENKAVKLIANLGGLEDGMRIIESVQGAEDKQPRALRADEQVIVNGIQRVRPGMKVDPKSADSIKAPASK